MRLKGQTAIVTGGRRGIGFQVARRIGLEGANVLIVSRSSETRDAAESLIREGICAVGLSLDLCDESAVQMMVTECLSRFGGIDILVNNAGVAGIGGIESVSLEDWKNVVNNNLMTAFLCSKFVFPHMKVKRSGKIVNVSSVAGRSSSSVAGVHYTASKAGIIGLTRQLAREGAPFGIRVNAVAPSQTDTEMLREGLNLSGKNPADIATTIPLGFIAHPDQVASVCLFLCTEDSSYMTGAVLDVNGGALL